MEFLMQSIARSVHLLAIGVVFVGCEGRSKYDKSADLASDFRNLLTVTQATAYLNNFPTVNVYGVSPLTSGDVGGVAFMPGTHLTARHAAALTSFDNLISVNAEYCNIALEFVEGMKASNVQVLVLSNSTITDEHAAAIAQLPSLQIVVVSNTSLTNKGVQLLLNAAKLQHVYTHPI